MKGLLLLIFIGLAYCIPNPVYTAKNCFYKLYGNKENANSELKWSAENELIHWKVNKFYEKCDKVDPTLRNKIRQCVDEVNQKYKLEP